MQLDLFTEPNAEKSSPPKRLVYHYALRVKVDRPTVILVEPVGFPFETKLVSIGLPVGWTTDIDPYGHGFARNPIGAGYPINYLIETGVAHVFE